MHIYIVLSVSVVMGFYGVQGEFGRASASGGPLTDLDAPLS